MRRAHRHSSGQGTGGGVMSSTSATVFPAAELADAEAEKLWSADRSGGNDAAKHATVLERLWRPVEYALMDICYAIEDRFIIPQNITLVPALVEEELTHRQGFLMLVGHFISISTLMVFAAYSRRLSNLMSGASPVMGEILFCVSHLSQVTQEQLGWSLFCTGFLSPSTFEWTTTEGGCSGPVAILSGGGSQGTKRQMLGANSGGGFGANGASAGGPQGSTGMGGGSPGGMAGCPCTGGNLVRYLLGRKANMIRQESLRSYLYSSFHSPSAFLVEQTVWFVVLAVTMDLVSMQRLAVAAFFANVVGWLPVYSVKSLAGLGVALVVGFMYWIPSSEVDDAVLSVTFLQRPLRRVLSAYCASLCITLLFAETLLLDDVRRVIVHALFSLPQRLLRVGGHHPVVAKLVHGCAWLRCEYFYFVDFYFFLGMMCWLSLVLMETAAGISVFGTAALLTVAPWLVGSGWRETPMQAVKDTVIYVGFYVVVALLLAHVVPWSGLAFLSNAVQSGAVLFLMAARCEHKQPGGSAYVLLWVAMMCVYLYMKAGTMRGTTGSLTWSLHDSNPRANFVKAAYAVWCGKPATEEGALSLLRLACITFWQLLSKGLSEEGMQLLHFNVVVFGSMLLFSTTMHAVFVEGVRFSSPGPAVSTSAEATSTPAAALAASTMSPLPTSTTAASAKGDHNDGAVQALIGRQCCWRGVLNGPHCSAPTSSSCAKNRAVPHVGGAKPSSSSTASTMRRSWQAPTQAAAAAIDVCVSGKGSDGGAVPGEGRSEETVAEALVEMAKVIEKEKETIREVGSVAQGFDEQLAWPAPPAGTGVSPVKEGGAPAALGKETKIPATPRTSASSASMSKRDDNQKDPRSQLSTASLTQNPTSVDEAVREENEKPPPQPIRGPNGTKTEAAAPVPPRDESDLILDASRSASPEKIVNCTTASFTSTMCRSDMSSPTPSSFRHEQAASLASRSSTAAETPLETRCERQERERDKDRRHERERVKTPASTTSSVSASPFPATKPEREEDGQSSPQQRTSKSSWGQKKSADTETPTAASSAPALPLPRSRTENLKKAAEATMSPQVTSRQTAVTESKEAVRSKNSVPDGRTAAASAAKAARLTESTASTGAASAAAGAEVGATNDKGKAARDSGEGKKAGGKAKVAADKTSTSSDAAAVPSPGDAKAVEPAAASMPVLFPLPKPHHGHKLADEAPATATVKAPAAAAKTTAGEAAGGEKRGSNNAASFPMPDKVGVATAKKAAAAAPLQISASAPAPTALSSQSVATAPAVLPLPLPRSAQAAEADSAAGAAQASPASGAQPHEAPLQQAWRDLRWASAASEATPAADTDESGPVSASGPKQNVKSKPSAAAAADDAEESDVSYDLDRVLNFLRLKINYAAGVDDGDDDDGSSSTVSNADCRHNPTSFLHSDSPEHSTTTPKRSLSNAPEVKCGVSAAAHLGVDASVSRTVPQRTEEAGAAHESLALRQPSGNEPITSIPQRVSQAIQSVSEWTVKSRSGFGDCRTDSFASTNHNSANSSGNCALHDRRSNGFHVFFTHPNAAMATKAAGSSLSPHPRPVHMDVASRGGELLPSEMMESGIELSAATRHMDFNAASSSLGHYQVSEIVAPPSPPLESRQSSSSHMPFSVSTFNHSGSLMSSMSSIGRSNSDTAEDRSSVLPRMRVAPNGRVSVSEQMATQKAKQSVSVADTMQQMQFAAPSMQQTMMVMMRAPDGQMALYPMVYNQPVYMADANRVMQPAQSVQMTSQPPPQQQQPIVYAAASPSPGQAVEVAYHIAPDGSYMMAALPRMPQQMMGQYQQQQQEPYQRF